MTEDLEARLSGLDGERPLPPELAARLETALVAAVAGGLVAEPPLIAEETIALDGPRPLPAHVRTRLEGALLVSRRRRLVPARAMQAVLAVAAVLALVVASVGLLGRFGPSGRGHEVTAAGPTGSTPSSAPATTAPASPFELAAPATTSSSTAGPAAPRSSVPLPPARGAVPASPGPNGGGVTTTATSPPATTTNTTNNNNNTSTNTTGPAGSAPAPGGAGPASPGSQSSPDPGPEPPYATPEAPSTTGAPSAAAPANPGPHRNATPAPPSGPALRIGVLGGDSQQEAGFRAYVDVLNSSGGVRGRPLEIVPVTAGSRTAGTIATVNLSPRPVASPGGAPNWVTGPLLETLTATEDLLPGGGRVFSFSSVPERQGHLVADAVFPQPAPAASAVIYTALDGPLAGPVPQAIESVLVGRGVRVTIEAYDPAHPPAQLRSADAAFLSLDTAAAQAWLRQAGKAGYSPGRGIAGIFSLADPALLPDLPEGTQVVSPYSAPSGNEGEAIRSGAGSTAAAVLHGWATAKNLAVALWRTGADQPDGVQAALEGLSGYDSGLAPPYETRSGTRSRTPEGIVLKVHSGAFVAQGAFRRDLH